MGRGLVRFLAMGAVEESRQDHDIYHFKHGWVRISDHEAQHSEVERMGIKRVSAIVVKILRSTGRSIGLIISQVIRQMVIQIVQDVSQDDAESRTTSENVCKLGADSRLYFHRAHNYFPD